MVIRLGRLTSPDPGGAGSRAVTGHHFVPAPENPGSLIHYRHFRGTKLFFRQARCGCHALFLNYQESLWQNCGLAPMVILREAKNLVFPIRSR